MKASPTPSTEDVLSGVAKCCFASSRLLKWLRDSDGALVKKLCQTTMDLWVYLPDTATAIHGTLSLEYRCITFERQRSSDLARDRLLEGLSSAHPDHLRSALEASAAEISFKLKLAESTSSRTLRVAPHSSFDCSDFSNSIRYVTGRGLTCSSFT